VTTAAISNTESPWLFLLSNPVDHSPGGEQCRDYT
jgi:hypothetical protein